MGSYAVAVSEGPCLLNPRRWAPPWACRVHVALIAAQAQVLVLALWLSAPPLIEVPADCR